MLNFVTFCFWSTNKQKQLVKFYVYSNDQYKPTNTLELPYWQRVHHKYRQYQ